MVRTSLVIGATTGAYGVAFGAAAASAGASAWQALALSLLVFSGGSQFAAVSVVGAGGSWGAGWAAAWLLGLRNGFYGLRVAPLVRRHRLPVRLAAAQVTIDESTAVAVANEADTTAAELGFWLTGVSVYVLWSLGTLVGALGAQSLGRPEAYGLDAAAPAAFAAFLAPQLRRRGVLPVVVVSLVLCAVAVPLTRPGIPVVLAVLPALVVAARRSGARAS
ncbi:putative branched-subunit amino acid permease [Motilibacter rhizosphaerae]|uniref:Putative branched-subunit amino acid permease n=1 Tax=Motilibacter rhizosphaerae TaxID=598652 RepID=A0A4Q7NB15_9ACTN|nr:putative branched-subunit amino acid permease [Motilibacter rhizosphaerae]